MEMAPYMTKCSQLETLFLENRQLFEKLVEDLRKYEELYYQYNYSFGRLLVEEKWGEIDFIDDLMYLFETLRMIIIEKNKNFLSFRQVKPVPENYIYIGMNYNYESNERTFSYYHLDNYRELDHKWIYRLYDLIYNRGNGKPLIS